MMESIVFSLASIFWVAQLAMWAFLFVRYYHTQDYLSRRSTRKKAVKRKKRTVALRPLWGETRMLWVRFTYLFVHEKSAGIKKRERFDG